MAPGPALTVAARPRPPSVWLRLSLGAGALLLGAVGLARTGEPPDVGRVPSAQVAPVHRDPPGPGHRPVTGPSGRAASGRSSPATTSPGRLALPRLGVDAPVQAVGVGPDRLLAVPDDPRTLGWWRGGATPGDAAGSVVVDGHVDSAERGPGALFHLSRARPGDRVSVTGRDGHRTGYTVVAVRRYPKTTLPAAEVFAQDVQPRLVLVTCGGSFDARTRHYADNVVVYAVPR